MIVKLDGLKFLILHRKHLFVRGAGFVTLIPLMLVFFILSLMEVWMFESYHQIKIQQLREMQIKKDVYITTYLSTAIENSYGLEIGTTHYLSMGEGENKLYIVSEDKKSNEKTVIWLIDFNGVSTQCSFIIEGTNGTFVKWKYR